MGRNCGALNQNEAFLWSTQPKWGVFMERSFKSLAIAKMITVEFGWRTRKGTQE